MATDLEVFRDTVNHRRPARVLYIAGFTPDLLRRLGQHIGIVGQDRQGVLPEPEASEVHDAIAAHYGIWQLARVHPRRPAGDPAKDYSRYWHGQELPPGTTINGVGVAQVPSGFYHFWGYVSPLREAQSLKEIEEYPLDDLSTWDYSDMAGQVAEAHGAGKVVTCFTGHMYETAWQIRGYEQFLMDMIERPSWAQCLLERLNHNGLAIARQFARAGGDMLGTGDDIANQNSLMFSPQIWRQMILAPWAKVWQEAKAINPQVRTWYHTDGNAMPTIGEMVDSGLDILNPLQPECLDIDEVYRRWGSRLCFDGCMGTQSTMPWGKPADVRDRVKHIIESYGRSGGLFISPTHVLEPEVPVANIEAMFDAVREYGTRE
jgi:uroporphyrinogen decarboxylase